MGSITEEELYTQYHDKVMGYLLNHVNNREEAEDITSEVFLKACRNFANFDEKKASASTWIFTIMKNTLTDHFRKDRPSAELDEELKSDEDIEDTAIRNEELNELAAALKKLPEELRDIVVLRYYDGYSLTEISEIMHISYGMIKVKHRNALDSLHKLLGN